MKRLIYIVLIFTAIIYFSLNQKEEINIVKQPIKSNIVEQKIEKKDETVKEIYALVSPKSPCFKIENNSIVQVLNYDRTPAYTKNDFIKVKVIKPMNDKYLLIECSDSRYAKSYLIVSKGSIIYLTNN